MHGPFRKILGGPAPPPGSTPLLRGIAACCLACLRFCSMLTEDFELVSVDGIFYRFRSLHQAFSDKVVKLHLT